MKILCDNCNEEFHIPTKNYNRRRGKIHKMLICPHCKGKNFIPILKGYHLKQDALDLERGNDWYNGLG